MKFSRYVVPFRQSGRCLIFNTRTKSLLLVSKEIFDLIRTKDDGALQNLNVMSVNQLRKSGNVIDDGVNELEYVKVLHSLRKYDTSLAGFSILMTKSCNFACTYCFESERRGTMTQESLAHLSLFLENMFPTLRSLNLSWTGGEPLLMWEELADISRFISTECKRRSINYEAGIGTNGYLLSEKMLKEFASLGIRRLHITLDGPKEIHDKRRMLSGGGSTFDTILDAIKLATSFLDVHVRVNIDDQNVDSFQSLIENIGVRIPKKEKIKLYCRPVVDCSKSNIPFAGGHFGRIEADLMKVANRKGFMIAFHPNARFGLRCPYYQCNSYYIDPALKLFKCPLHLDSPSKAVASIDESGSVVMTDQRNYLDAIVHDPFNLPECRHCRVLPLCYGKCAPVYESSGKKRGVGCIPEKHTLEQKLQQALISQERFEEFRKDLHGGKHLIREENIPS